MLVGCVTWGHVRKAPVLREGACRTGLDPDARPRAQCGELEARLLALGAPLPPAPGCAAGAGARSGSDSDAHSSERLPLPAGKRARSADATPGAAAADRLGA